MNNIEIIKSKHCDNCSHNKICREWAITSGLPFVNCETCKHYKINKENPQKPLKIYTNSSYSRMRGRCPSCNNNIEFPNRFINNISKQSFCNACGQTLDWSDFQYKKQNPIKKLIFTIKTSIEEDPKSTFLLYLTIANIINSLILIIFYFIQN